MRDWDRTHTFALLTLLVGVLALGATVLTVPDFRWRVLHDAKYAPHFVPPGAGTETVSTSPQQSVSAAVVKSESARVPSRTNWIEVHSSAVSASSVLPPSRVATYGPEMATDGRWNTVWVEGASGDGSGEWIELELPSSATVSKIGIVNGYGKGTRFLENERVRQAQITFSDGTSQTIRLADHNDIQYFDLSPRRTTSLRLTMLSVYPGTRWDDAAIGEIRLWGPGDVR